MKSFLSALLKRILKYSLIATLLWIVLMFACDLGADTENIIMNLIVNLLTCFAMGFVFAAPVALVVSILSLFTKPKGKCTERIKSEPEKPAVTEEQKNTTADFNEPSKQTTNNEPFNFTPTITISFDSKHYSDDNEPLVKKKLLHLKTLNDYRKFKNYIVLDVETTGLDRTFDKIIEIGMLKIKDGTVVDKYETFVNPEMHIPSNASAVNGIFDVDVENAPIIDNIIQDIVDFIEDLPIVGHNTNFDIAFVAREIERKEIQKDLYYYDTISICKDVSLPVPNHKLETIMRYFEIKELQSHRAIDDAEVTLAVLQKCIALKLELHDKELAQKREQKKADEAIRKKKYSASPLYNVGFAFTGDFDNEREDMIHDLKSVGGLVKERVSKNSRYLVKGDIDDLPDWALERKYEKAIELSDAGYDIEIISEDEFYILIENARLCLEND